MNPGYRELARPADPKSHFNYRRHVWFRPWKSPELTEGPSSLKTQAMALGFLSAILALNAAWSKHARAG